MTIGAASYESVLCETMKSRLTLVGVSVVFRSAIVIGTEHCAKPRRGQLGTSAVVQITAILASSQYDNIN